MGCLVHVAAFGERRKGGIRVPSCQRSPDPATGRWSCGSRKAVKSVELAGNSLSA